MADDLGSKIHASSELFGDQKWCNWRIIECSTNSLGNSLSGAALSPCPLVGGLGELGPDYFLLGEFVSLPTLSLLYGLLGLLGHRFACD